MHVSAIAMQGGTGGLNPDEEAIVQVDGYRSSRSSPPHRQQSANLDRTQSDTQREIDLNLTGSLLRAGGQNGPLVAGHSGCDSKQYLDGTQIHGRPG